MNKSDLVREVERSSKKGDFASHAGAERAINNLFGLIRREVQRGGKVSISGFGTFSPCLHKKRKGTNPQSGELITIPEKTVAKFAPSPKFMDPVENPDAGKEG